MEAQFSESISIQEAASENTSCDRLLELALASTDLARLVAKNPCTTPDLLEELSISSDLRTRENVATNPNTPTEVLLNLGAEFPEQLLDNPMFSLLLLENLNLVDEIPLNTLRSILKQEQVPVYFLEQAADKQDLEVQLAIAMNAKTPRQGLEKAKLLQSHYPQVVEAVQLHVTWAGEMTEGWDEAAREVIQTITPSYSGDVNYLIGDRDYLVVLAQLGFIPEFLVKHWQENWIISKKVLEAVAGSINTSSSVLEQLASDKSDNSVTIRAGVARNPNTPVYLLEQLVEDRGILMSHGSVVRYGVGQNPNLPVYLLEQLARDKDTSIRRAVAQNPNTPVYVLKQLLEDRHVHEFVVQNVNLPVNLLERWIELMDDSRLISAAQRLRPVHLLEKLAKYKHRTVGSNPNARKTRFLEEVARIKEANLHAALARNHNTTATILEQLAQDETSGVREVVAMNPKTPALVLEQLAQDEVLSIRAVVANNPNTSVRILLEQLAQNGSPHTRSIVARNLHTPVSILEQLAQDKELDVRTSVAGNPNTPVELLKQLVQDKKVLDHADMNLSIDMPEGFLKYLLIDELRACKAAVEHYLDQNHEGCFHWVLEGYAKSKYPVVRLLVLLHPQISSRVLTEKSRSSAWLERYAVAQNPSTPTQIRQQLAQDGNRIVRATAIAYLQQHS